jgi:homoserine O-acetyltransferase
MTTTLQAVQAASPALAAGTARAPGQVLDGTSVLPDGLSLEHGGRLGHVEIAWRLVGPAGAPLVAVLGGISATRAVVDESGGPGWWPGLVGSGRGLDTDRFRVLSFDWLGGSGDTTGPAAGSFGRDPFPAVSPADQAAALAGLLEALEIRRLHAFVGASYGGMVALSFAAAWPERLGRLLVISAADRAHPLATAWRSVQRDIVRLGLRNGAGRDALALARGLAMTTYRSPEEFEARFAGTGEASDSGFRFPVDSYLAARGADFVDRVLPEAYLTLSESIDLQRADAAAITAPATLVAVSQDQLVPAAQMRRLARRLGGPVRLVELDSLYGHDAFLKEHEALTPVFTAALEGADQ